MSGIAGIVDLSGGHPVTEEELRRMASLLVHRGPDAEGIFVSPSRAAGLACRRLVTTDAEHGAQPMQNEDGRVVLAHDGSIYNAPDLRKVLISRKHHFRSRSDGEVILHLYEDHGPECVSALRGTFALAVWDEGTRTLWLSRDRLGKKPLYFAQSPGRLYFGSEAKALLVHPEVSREVDLEALDLYLCFGYVPAPKTIYRGVSKLPPGHSLVAKDGRVGSSTYWEPAFVGEGTGDLEEWGEKVFNELFEAVKVRLLSDVPLGVLLSGGLSSSIVAGLMNLADPGRVKSFALAFEGDEGSELEHARAVARHFATDHHETIVKAEPASVLEALARQQDEPFADASAVPAYYLARFARGTVTVAMSGDGGDEVFLGHPRYQTLERPEKEDAPSETKRMAGRIGKKITDRLLPTSRLKRKATRLMERLSEAPEERYLGWIATFNREDRVRYYGDALHDKMTDPWQAIEHVHKKSPWPSGPGAAGYVDLFTSLPNGLLAKVDAASMACSLEVRCPMLDHLVVETALTIPPSVRMAQGQTKALLRYAFLSLAPQQVLEREKAGFEAPLKRWLLGPLQGMARDLLLDAKGKARGYLKPGAVEGMLEAHHSGKADHAAKLWSLLMLEMWHRAHV